MLRALLLALGTGSPAGAKEVLPELYGRATDGPFPSIAAFCLAHHQQGCFLNDDFGPDAHAPLEKIRPPWRSARLFATGDAGFQTYYLAMETAKGFYMQEVGSADAGLVLREFVLREGASPPPLVLRLGTVVIAAKDKSRDEITHLCMDHEALCGIGPSGAPSCVLLTAATGACERYDGNPKSATPRWDWEVTVKLSADVADLQVRGGKDAPTKLAGRHRLVFP